jgi:hypothetical protein
MMARPHIRRVAALFLLAWLNLVVQPCFAIAASMPAQMAHCAHDGMPAQPDHCIEMQADDCIVGGDLNLEAPRASGASHAGALLAVLPPEARLPARPASHAAAGDCAGPPLTILYCSLRN